jgi:hypothetical protein
LLQKCHKPLNCALAAILRHNEPFIRPNWPLPSQFTGAETCGFGALGASGKYWAGLHLITRVLVMEEQGRRLFEKEGLKAVPSLTKTEQKR